MKRMESGPERMAVIRQMVAILERERPWIELFHDESYLLVQPWLKNVKTFGLSYPTVKYVDIDTAQRARLRRAWNAPVEWPLWVLLGLVIVFFVPGVVTFFRERQ